MATTGAARVLSTLPGDKRRPQPLLGLRRAQEEDAQRLRVGGGRAHLGEVERLDEQRVGHGPVEKGVVGARLGKELRQRGRANRRAAFILEFGHGNLLASQHGPSAISATGKM